MTTQSVLLEAAGLLRLIGDGLAVPNVKKQAHALVEKIGEALDDGGEDAPDEDAPDITQTVVLIPVAVVEQVTKALNAAIGITCVHAKELHGQMLEAGSALDDAVNNAPSVQVP